VNQGMIRGMLENLGFRVDVACSSPTATRPGWMAAIGRTNAARNAPRLLEKIQSEYDAVEAALKEEVGRRAK